MRALTFNKSEQQKGWNCWNGNDHAGEGILLFNDGGEIPCCLRCAKSRFRYKKNWRKYKVRDYTPPKQRSLILEQNHTGLIERQGVLNLGVKQ